MEQKTAKESLKTIMNELLVNSKEAKERIDWDTYFMFCAVGAALRSPCSRLHVGCVIVRNNRVICTGYNGFLAGMPHDSVVRDNHEQATIHAEQNAISYAANDGISVKDGIIYITHYPCLNCAKLLAASGITKVIYKDDYNNDPLVAKICTNLNIVQYK
jgi:dCMP deaminase